MHGIKATDACFIDDGFRPTADDDIGVSGTDVIQGIDQCVGGRGTRRYCGEVGSPQPMAHGNVARRNIQNHFRDEERVETGRSITSGKAGYFIQKGFKTTNTRTPNHTDSIRIQFIECQRCISNRSIRDSQSVMYKWIYFPGFFALHEILGVEPLHFTSKTRLEFRRVKLRDWSSAAYSFN